MALSNIFREPRREITETVIGLILLALALLLDYWGALKIKVLFPQKFGSDPMWFDMLLLVIMTFTGLALAAILIIGVPILVHTIGENICNALADRGIELRPRQRYSSSIVQRGRR